MVAWTLTLCLTGGVGPNLFKEATNYSCLTCYSVAETNNSKIVLLNPWGPRAVSDQVGHKETETRRACGRPDPTGPLVFGMHTTKDEDIW